MNKYDAFKSLWDRVIKLEERVAALEMKISIFENSSPAPDMVIDDEIFEDVKVFVIQIGQVSASILQRRFKIGYARAARLLDMLEEQGIIGPANGAAPRDVLI